jgi:hypothetical protein
MRITAPLPNCFSIWASAEVSARRLLAIAVEMEAAHPRIAAAALPRDPHGADGLVGGAAARSGDAGDGHGHRGARVDQRARDHLEHRLLAHRAVADQRLRPHAEERLLGLVGIGRDAAVEPAGAAGDVGDGLGDPAARAGLGGDQGLPGAAQQVADGLGQPRERGVVVDHRA